MENIYRLTVSLLNNHQIIQTGYPSPVEFIGHLPDLTGGNFLVIGPYGSGKRRIVLENIRTWYHQGHPALVGNCNPTQPFHPFIELLESLSNYFESQKIILKK